MIPPELTELPQWVVWRLEERDGKPTKVPYNSARPSLRASATDPSSWGSYELAVEVAERRPGIDGIGFVTTADDPFTGVDLDGVIGESGSLKPGVAEILARLRSYTERTPSGRGLRVWVRAELNGGRRRTSRTPWGGEFEVYNRDRYFTVTGEHVAASPATIEARQEELNAVCAELFPPATEPPQRTAAPIASPDDREIIERASRARNGAKFEALWAGDTSGHDGDDSRADLALCSSLAFWAGPDPARIDALFRQSGLMREKWERDDYRERTITTAISGQRDFYPWASRMAPVGMPEPGTTVGDDREAPTSLRFLTPAELRAETPPEPDWLLDGYIAPGVLTIGPAGKPKVGKSTLALAIVRAIRGNTGTFLGRRVRQTTVVYLSEEGGSTLLHKLPAADDGLHILTRDNAYPRPEWAGLVREAADYAESTGASPLLVVDTFPYWAALAAEREKDSGAIQEAIEPLLQATRRGIAVLLPTHTRKSGGEDGDALRGSGALVGAGDVILELERPTGQTPAPRQRVLAALSRYPQTPGVLVIEHDAGTDAWTVVGQGDDRRDTRTVADRAALLSTLPADEPGMTRQEIEQEIGSPHQQFAPVLTRLIDDGHATRDGAGKKGDPYRYRILRTGDAAHHRAETAHHSGGEGSLSAAYVVAQKEPTTALMLRADEPCAETAPRSDPPVLDAHAERLLADHADFADAA